MIKISRLYFYLIVSAVLIVFDYYGFLSFVKEPSEVLIVPVKQIVYKTSRSLFNFGYIIWHYPQIAVNEANRKDLIAENESLKEKVSLLTDENDKLREQLGSPLPLTYRFIPGTVIAVSRFMEIAVGREDGVSAGMAVVTGNNLVGRVVNVGRHRSNVLISADSETVLQVKTSRGTKGILSGQNGSSLILTKILQKDPLFLDDQVTTSGENGLPPNLLVGRISHITSDDISAYKEAQITSYVDFKSLKTVFVIDNHES